MRKTMMLAAALVGAALATGCAGGPQTYTNEFVTNHTPRKAYKVASIDARGYVADQLVLAMRDKVPSMAPHEGEGDVHVVMSSTMQVLPTTKKLFKPPAMRPVVTTVTLQVVRSEDQEVIYSLVKQYEIVISAGKRGSVNIATNGWVDQAAAELAQGLAAAIGAEG